MQEKRKPHRATFGRSKRLSGREEFRKLFSVGKTIRGEWMTLKIAPGPTAQTRFACVISKKVASAAVARNRIRRWFKESFRRNQDQFPSGNDMVAVILKIPGRLSYRQAEQTLMDLVKRWAEKASSS